KGTYFVIVTNSAGCSKTSSGKAIPVPNPVATITASAPDICPGETVVLTANSGTGYTYKWFINNALVSGDTQQTFDATSPNTYGVRVTNSMGCIANSAAKIITARTVCNG